jgi:serine/threonine-protein kinase
VFDFGFDQLGSAYIVMELLEGEPMDRRLERIGRFTPFDTVRLMKQICTSLHAAHAKGIIHRDLKPENLFIVGDPAVTGGERAKILDFGIAKLSGDEPGKMKTRTGMVMGTPVYMSPEQCRGAGVVDQRSDIYSIGCVMMTMLTGRPPFDGAGSGELIVAHMREAPPLAASRIPDLPPILDQILQRCLAKDPAARFQTMMELAQALGQAEQLTYHLQQAPSTGPYGYAPSGPTPMYAHPSSPMLAPPAIASQPTTLSSAASQIATPRRGRGILIGFGLTTLLAGGAVAIGLATRGHDDTKAADPATVATPAAAPDASIVKPAASPDAAVTATVTPDAAPPDAAAVVEIAPDAHTAKKVTKVSKHSGGDHGPPQAGSDVSVDRGD